MGLEDSGWQELVGEQSARINALEADVSSVRDSLNAALESRAMMERERDALRVERDALTMQVGTLVLEHTRIIGENARLRAALDDALAFIANDNIWGPTEVKRLRAIAEGK